MAYSLRIRTGWRPPSQHTHTEPLLTSSLFDPNRLIAVNAISLVAALIGNFSLLLHMAERIPFMIAQPITIAGFALASVLLIGLLGKAGGDSFHKPGVADQALSQAFYYAIMAAIIYGIISILMTITVVGAFRGYYPKEFKLTMSQRTLMLQTISFMVYLLAGGAVYGHIEGWNFLDAIYWADFTLLTVGIGDYSPATHLGRGLLFPYAIFGIVILGLVVGSIRSLVLERGKKKMSARMTEKTRERLLNRLKSDEKGKAKINPLQNGERNVHGHTEQQRRKQEFELMREVQERAATERKWTSFFISAGAWFVLWFVGAVVFEQSEQNQKWTYFGSLYFAYTSLLTIGCKSETSLHSSGETPPRCLH